MNINSNEVKLWLMSKGIFIVIILYFTQLIIYFVIISGGAEQ